MSVATVVYGNVDWGFGATDIWSNSMTVVGSLATFVVLGVVVAFTPTIIKLIRKTIQNRR